MAGLRGNSNVKVFVVAGVLVAFALALLVSPFASSSPDGLEKVAADEGFDESAREHQLSDSPLADYAVDGVGDGELSTGLSGVIGVALTFGIGLALFGVLRLLRTSGADESGRDDTRAPT